MPRTKEAAKGAAKLKAGAKEAEPTEKHIRITRPRFEETELTLIGDVPYVQLRFGEKAKNRMKEEMKKGSLASKKKRVLPPRDFDDDYEQSMYRGPEGEYGIPATSFRQSMIRACNLAGLHMTIAKCTLFVVADFFDPRDGMPLVKMENDPHYCEHIVRNKNGSPDIRVRAMWDPGWKCKVRIRFASDQFCLEEVVNVMIRSGLQVGIGEGRPFSKDSAGMGWGTFEVVEAGTIRKAA